MVLAMRRFFKLISKKKHLSRAIAGVLGINESARDAFSVAGMIKIQGDLYSTEGGDILLASVLPAPVAIISTDAQTLPSAYVGGYFPAATDLNTYRGYAPWPIFFCGWLSTTFDLIAEFMWDFGPGTETDYGGRYFEGINAAHVFETPGTYNVTLTITDYLGRTSSATRTVVIYQGGAGHNSIKSYGSSDAVGAFSGSSYALNTYYVDPVNGNDTYNGKSQTVDGGNIGPWQTLNKAVSMLHKASPSIGDWPLKPGDKVLFKKGEIFNFNGTFSSFGHGTMCQGIHFGAYGSGANPRMQWTGTANINIDNAVFDATGFGAGFISFTDIDWYMNNSGVHTLSCVWRSLDASRNVLFLRNSFYDHLNSVLTMDTPDHPYYINEPYGAFLIGCYANQDNVISTATVLFFYGAPAALCLIGNTADHSGNHTNYIGNPHGGIIADNVFSRPAFGRTGLRITGGVLTSPAEKMHVTRNKVLGWIDPLTSGSAHNGGGTRYNFQIMNLSHNSTAMDEVSQDIVFDNNLLTNFEAGVSIVNVKNLIFRNNILITPSSATLQEAIRLGDSGGVGQARQIRVLENIKVINNTLVYNGTYASQSPPFIRINGNYGCTAPYHTGIDIRNNIAISASGRADLFIKFQNNDGQIDQVILDNNLFDASSSNWGDVAGTQYTLSAWKSNFTKDISSLKSAAGVVAPPSARAAHASGNPSSLAAEITEINTYIAALQLALGSAAIDAGNDSVSAYKDYFGIHRPQGAHKDIGAFEKV